MAGCFEEKQVSYDPINYYRLTQLLFSSANRVTVNQSHISIVLVAYINIINMGPYVFYFNFYKQYYGQSSTLICLIYFMIIHKKKNYGPP